jgi:hypothetical protein
MWTASSSRFLFPALVVLVPISVVWCHRLPMLGGLYLRLLWVGTVCFLLQMTGVGVSASGVRAAVLVAAGLCGLYYGLAWLVPRMRRGARVPFAVLALSAGLLLLRDLRAESRGTLMLSDFALHDVPRYWVNAALSLDDPAQTRRIAVTSGPWQNADNWFAASFLGQALQNDVLYVSPLRDGTIPHFGLGDLNYRIARDADADAWIARLRARHITHVVSFSPAALELGWMRVRSGQFRQLHGDSNWGVFEFQP